MRRADWIDRLLATADAARDMPFAWGQHDCCLFAARCVDAMCDTVYAEQLATQYSDERSALAYIATWGDLRSAVCEWLGETVRRPALLRRGDVVLFRDAAGQEAIGVCLGATVAAASRDGGLALLPMSAAITGWRVD